jgi:hypothetical protein
VGFLDKLKGTAKQAMSPGAAFSERDKIMRINEVGVERRATVDSMRELGTQLGGGHEMEFELTVQGDGGATYRVTTRQSLHDATLQGIAEGGQVIVKVDPENPESLLVWGAASPIFRT